jgi:hypothetical protein
MSLHPGLDGRIHSFPETAGCRESIEGVPPGVKAGSLCIVVAPQGKSCRVHFLIQYVSNHFFSKYKFLKLQVNGYRKNIDTEKISSIIVNVC